MQGGQGRFRFLPLGPPAPPVTPLKRLLREGVRHCTPCLYCNLSRPRLRGRCRGVSRDGRGITCVTWHLRAVPLSATHFVRVHERWLEYGRLAARLLHMCQDMRVNALVGTRSPYSLPFVILPVPARSPFRFIRHRRRSTPNLASSSTGRARLESPARGDSFWVVLPPACPVEGGGRECNGQL